MIYSFHSFAPLTVLALALLGGCAAVPAPAIESRQAQQEIDELGLAILALGDDVDPGEARQAARIATEYSRQLALEYEIESSPLMHNVMVNLGFKERGLCKDWTRDLLVRMREEDFDSIAFEWAIANYARTFKIEHSTVIVTARGSSIEQGLVLDGWRHSGNLYWAPTLDDPDYRWSPAREVFALKKELAAEAETGARIR